MPSMRRRLFTFFSALSLLLCVAVAVLGVRSYWVADTFLKSTHVEGEWLRRLHSSRGGLFLLVFQRNFDATGLAAEPFWERQPPTDIYLRVPRPGEVGVRQHFAI